MSKTQLIYKKLKVDIVNDGLVSTNGVVYNGAYPINVDNTTQTISFEQRELEKKQDKLTFSTNHFENIDNHIKLSPQFTYGIDEIGATSRSNKVDIENIQREYVRNFTYNTGQEQQDSKIQGNTDLINKIIAGLQGAGIATLKGIWTQGTTAKIGEMWIFDNKIYICIVPTTTSQPSLQGDWNLVSSIAININDFYTKLQIDALVQDLQNKINEKLSISEFNNFKEQNTQKINTKQDKLTFNNEQFNVRENYVNISDKLSGKIDDLQTVSNILSTDVKNIKGDLSNSNNKINSIEKNIDRLDKSIALNTGKIDTKQDKLSFNQEEFRIDGNNVNLNPLLITRINNLDGSTKTLTSDVGTLKTNVNNINKKFNDYYTKAQIDQTNRITSDNIDNLERKNQNLTSNINDINNRFNSYYTKQDWDNFKVDHVKTNLISIGYDHLKINNYKDTEITLTAPQKITSATVGDDNVEKFRTEVSVNGFYINGLKAQPTKNTEITGSSAIITDIGNNKVMVIAQAYIRDNLGSGADLFRNLPDEVRRLNNVDNIEYFEYNFIEMVNNKNKVFTNYVGNVAASVYNNRIYLRNENNIADYIHYIRFKLVYNKR